MAESEASTQDERNRELYSFRDGNVFVIDVSPEMFKTNEAEGDTYFLQCLNTYGRILSRKLMWNKRDWMGLIFFNCTKDWDRSPETKHIRTVQKFSEVTTEMMSEILNIYDHKAKKEDYCQTDPAPDITYDNCLHDVLWQACRSFDSINIAMPIRQVILMTCRDNPLPDDEAQRHEIRLRTTNYRDLSVRLRIVGLGNDWNHELFYKDIDVLAGNATIEDTSRTKPEDLEVQVNFPARASGHLKWKIGDGVEIRTVLMSFSSKTKYLKKVRMHKDTNEILEVYRHWGKSRQFGDDSEDEEHEHFVKIGSPDKVCKGAKFGGKVITFNNKEVTEFRTPLESGINLIGFKPIALDLKYHVKGTKFIALEDSASHGEIELFAALLSKCDSKNVMAICAVTHRGAPYLAKMIPYLDFGGFYLYKMAFREQINGLENYTKPYVYGTDGNDPLPISPEGVDLMKKMLKKLRIIWDPNRFTNRKLNAQLSYIESLALDIEHFRPADTTLPNRTLIRERLSGLADKFDQLFIKPDGGVKRVGSAPRVVREPVKKIKLDDKVVENLVKNGQLKQSTVVNLRAFARLLGLQATGLKSQLVERITAHYERTNVRK